MVGADSSIPFYFARYGAARDRSDFALPRTALCDHFLRHPEVGYMVTLNLAAVIGQRLQLFQAMWLREMERMVELRCA